MFFYFQTFEALCFQFSQLSEKEKHKLRYLMPLEEISLKYKEHQDKVDVYILGLAYLKVFKQFK